jgi:hypothetical protein
MDSKAIKDLQIHYTRNESRRLPGGERMFSGELLGWNGGNRSEVRGRSLEYWF